MKKIISTILLITFLAQDIVWAHPDPFIANSAENNKLAPKSVFKDPSNELAERYYSALLLQNIENACEKIGMPVNRVNFNSVKVVLKKLKPEPWMKIIDPESDEFFVQFQSGNMLRFYDPDKMRISKYGNELIEEISIPEGSLFRLQYLKVRAIPTPGNRPSAPKSPSTQASTVSPNVSFGKGVALRHNRVNIVIELFPKKILKRGQHYEQMPWEDRLNVYTECANAKKIQEAIRCPLKNSYDIDKETAGRAERMEKNLTVIEVDLPSHFLIHGNDVAGDLYWQITHIGKTQGRVYISKQFLDELDIKNPVDMECLFTILNHDEFELDRIRELNLDTKGITFEQIEAAHHEAMKCDPFNRYDDIEMRFGTIYEPTDQIIRNEIPGLRREIARKHLERRALDLAPKPNSKEAAMLDFELGKLCIKLGCYYDILEDRRNAITFYVRAAGHLKKVSYKDSGLLPGLAQERIVYLYARERMTADLLREIDKLTSYDAFRSDSLQYISEEDQRFERNIFNIQMSSWRFQRVKDQVIYILDHHINNEDNAAERDVLLAAKKEIDGKKYMPMPRSSLRLGKIIHEINMRSTGKRFSDITDEDLIRLRDDSGATMLWLMGVWQTSPYSKAANDYWRDKNKEPLERTASAYAITDYAIAENLGGEKEYRDLVKRANALGLRVMLDVVPNHMAVDSPLFKKHPEYFMNLAANLSEEEAKLWIDGNRPRLKLMPENTPNPVFQADTYGKEDSAIPEPTSQNIFYYGRDRKYNDGNGLPWIDNVQFNYTKAAMREYMRNVLFRVAELTNGGGIRLDMVFLTTKNYIRSNWFSHLSDDEFNKLYPEEEFWKTVVRELKEKYPNLVILAEMYGSHGHGNLADDLGFDYYYEDYFLKCIVSRDVQGLKKFLRDYVGALGKKNFIKYLENHDSEDRIINLLKHSMGEKDAVPASLAAATLLYTLPGGSLIYAGQERGYSAWISKANIIRGPPQQDNQKIIDQYKTLGGAVHNKLYRDIFRSGSFKLIDIGNPDAVLAFEREYNGKKAVIIVNYCNYFTGNIRVPVEGREEEINLPPWGTKIYLPSSVPTIFSLENFSITYFAKAFLLLAAFMGALTVGYAVDVHIIYPYSNTILASLAAGTSYLIAVFGMAAQFGAHRPEIYEYDNTHKIPRFGKVYDEDLRKDGYRYFMTSYGKSGKPSFTRFKYRWNMFESLDDQVMGNIEEREWIVQVTRDIASIQKTYVDVMGLKEKIPEERKKEIEEKLKEIKAAIEGPNIKLPNKQMAAGYIITALGSFRAGGLEDMRESYRNINLAIHVLDERKKDIESIYHALRRRMQKLTAWTLEMNSYMASLTTARDADHLYGLANRAEIKSPDNEPEFEGIEPMTREAIRLGENADLNKVRDEILSANILHSFMRDYRDIYYETRYSAIGGPGQALDQEQVFHNIWLKYSSDGGLKLGPPEYWYARFYQAAFIHQTILNPEKRSERIFNPTFKAATILIRLLKIGDIDSILKARSLLLKEQFAETRTFLEGFAEKKTKAGSPKLTIYDLSVSERRELVRSIAQSLELDNNDRVVLNRCAGIFFKEIDKAAFKPGDIPWRTLGLIGIIITSAGFALYTGNPMYMLTVFGMAAQFGAHRTAAPAAQEGYWWSKKRIGGILCPLFAMRRQGNQRIGDLKSLEIFMDFLEKQKADMVVLLPTTQTNPSDPCPYSSISLFANNAVMYMPLDELIGKNSADPNKPSTVSSMIDYRQVFSLNNSILRRLFEDFYNNYENHIDTADAKRFNAYVQDNKEWIEDYSVFHAIFDHYNGRDWSEWDDEGLKRHKKDAVEKFRREHEKEVVFYQYAQWLYYERWQQVREYAHKLNKHIVGDMPIYPASNSADVWANQEIFDLSKETGAPPEPIAPEGQSWGTHPYMWDEKYEKVLDYWERRIRHAAKFYDGVRIDHLLGIFSEWLIDIGKPATDGRFYPASPEKDAYAAARGVAIMRRLAKVAEDHGLLLIGEDIGGRPDIIRKAIDDLSAELPNLYLYNPVGWREKHMAKRPHVMVVDATHDTPATFRLRWPALSANPTDRKNVKDFLAAHGVQMASSAEDIEAQVIKGMKDEDFYCLTMQEIVDDDTQINVPGTGTKRPENWAWLMPRNIEDLIGNAAAASAHEERVGLINSIVNIFKVGQGLDLAVDEIEKYIVVDTTNDPYRIARKLPIVIAMKGEIFKNCPLDKKPLLMAFCGRGTISDPNLILDPRTKLGLAHEGTQLANSMEVKNAIWEIPYHGKKTTFAVQDKDNWVGMPVLYGPEDIFEMNLLMGKGGDRITRLGAEIASESGKADEDRVFAEYTKAMVAARLLCFSIIDGPDMMRDVDRRMGIMVKAASQTVDDINASAAELGLKPIDRKEVLKPTTSNPESEGGFSHTKWMVTSRGVVQGTLSSLRWLHNVQNEPSKYKAKPVDFVRNLKINYANVSCLIQGFGDVGSGIAKLLADENYFGKFNLNIRGVSNKFFALYNEAGLAKEFLLEARSIAEDDPDLLTVKRLLEMKTLPQLRGSRVWIANPINPKTKEPVFTNGDIGRISVELQKIGIEAIFGDAQIVNELIYQKATILFPAAAANVINDISQIGKLNVSVIAEGANNAIKRSLQPDLTKAGIMYLPGELMNGGGIYTSKEDIRHNHIDTPEAIVANPEYYRIHVTDEIDVLALQRTLAFLDRWAENPDVDLVNHVRAAAKLIFAAADELVREYVKDKNSDIAKFVAIDQERTLGRLPLRHSLYEIAIEMAPFNIIYHTEDIPGMISTIDELKNVREDQKLDNFKICRVRVALFSLMKMSYYLNNEQCERLIDILLPIIPDKSIDPLVRKEALACLGIALKWHKQSAGSQMDKAIDLFNKIAASKDEPVMLRVWSQFALYRILGVGYLEDIRNGVAAPESLAAEPTAIAAKRLEQEYDIAGVPVLEYSGNILRPYNVMPDGNILVVVKTDIRIRGGIKINAVVFKDGTIVFGSIIGNKFIPFSDSDDINRIPNDLMLSIRITPGIGHLLSMVKSAGQIPASPQNGPTPPDKIDRNASGPNSRFATGMPEDQAPKHRITSAVFVEEEDDSTDNGFPTITGAIRNKWSVEQVAWYIDDGLIGKGLTHAQIVSELAALAKAEPQYSARCREVAEKLGGEVLAGFNRAVPLLAEETIAEAAEKTAPIKRWTGAEPVGPEKQPFTDAEIPANNVPLEGSSRHSEIVDLVGDNKTVPTIVTLGGQYQKPGVGLALKRAIAQLSHFVPPRPRILVIGAVPFEIEVLLRQYPDAAITAVDVTRSQLDAINSYLENIPDFANQVRLYRADAAGLDRTVFPDASFDMIFAMGMTDVTFRSDRDRLTVLKNIATEEVRLLTPGNILVHPMRIEQAAIYYGPLIKDGYISPVGKPASSVDVYQRTSKAWPQQPQETPQSAGNQRTLAPRVLRAMKSALLEVLAEFDPKPGKNIGNMPEVRWIVKSFGRMPKEDQKTVRTKIDELAVNRPVLKEVAAILDKSLTPEKDMPGSAPPNSNRYHTPPNDEEAIPGPEDAPADLNKSVTPRPRPAVAEQRFVFVTKDGSDFIEIGGSGRIIRGKYKPGRSNTDLLEMWRKEETDEAAIRAINLALQPPAAEPIAPAAVVEYLADSGIREAAEALGMKETPIDSEGVRGAWVLSAIKNVIDVKSLKKAKIFEIGGTGYAYLRNHFKSYLDSNLIWNIDNRDDNDANVPTVIKDYRDFLSQIKNGPDKSKPRLLFSIRGIPAAFSSDVGRERWKSICDSLAVGGVAVIRPFGQTSVFDNNPAALEDFVKLMIQFGVNVEKVYAVPYPSINDRRIFVLRKISAPGPKAGQGPTAPAAAEQPQPSSNNDAIGAMIGETDRQFREGLAAKPFPEEARILLFEELFDIADAEHLKDNVFKDNKIMAIATFDDIAMAATQGEDHKEKVACVMTRRAFERLSKIKGFEQNRERLKATILVLDEKLEGANYLYLEGVVGFAKEMMEKDKDISRIKMYMKFLFNDVQIDEAYFKDSLELALHAALKFKPITKANIEEVVDRYKRMVEDALMAA